ncbi:leukotriene C4 synthase-like isoform 1-T1 [Discoglossus pictus]
MTSSQIIPLDHIVLLAAVTFLGILEQAYFALQVIAARRKYNVPAPKTSGSEEFDRIFRAQVNCTEYFPMFLASLWLAGLFFHQGTAAACGLVYLYARYRYFTAYKESSKLSDSEAYFIHQGPCLVTCSVDLLLFRPLYHPLNSILKRVLYEE